MHITHEEAHRLIQLARDEMLDSHLRGILDSHLAMCLECRNYSASIHSMESILRPLMQKQWAQQPTPLSVDAVISGPSYSSPNSALLATRIAAIGIMFAVFMFSVWRLASAQTNMVSPMLPSDPPVPISSTSTRFASTTTQTQTETCEETTYLVQGDDTLASIAYRFSTSKKEIMIANKMESETIIQGTKLIISVCNFTPTGTASTLTTTFTPILHPITSTPGG